MPRKRSRVQCVCKVCETPFETKPSEVARGGGLYCSIPCRRIAVHGPRRSFETNFWSKVVKQEGGGCWLWTGSKVREYGRVGVGSSLKLAHRVAWELLAGPIPEGMQLRHRCPGGPNPSCVRPDHMRLGTIQDNMDDRRDDGHTRGGVNAGEKNPRSKLTAQDVGDILALYATGEHGQYELAARYGVAQATISKIVRGQRWKQDGRSDAS